MVYRTVPHLFYVVFYEHAQICIRACRTKPILLLGGNSQHTKLLEASCTLRALGDVC